jgi:hypothetical protein
MHNFARILSRGPGMAAILVLLLSFAAEADEIYKWVDKEGKTHYSSRKEDAEGGATTTMRSNPAPPLDSSAPPAARAANEDVIRRPASSGYDPKSSQPPVVQKPVAPNYAAESQAAKCQLARDILSGSAKHHNGAAVDAYDRQIAENDVRTFCGK